MTDLWNNFAYPKEQPVKEEQYEVLFTTPSDCEWEGERDWCDDGFIRYAQGDDDWYCTRKQLPTWGSKDGCVYNHSGEMSSSHRSRLPRYWERRWGKDSPQYQYWLIWLKKSPVLYQELYGDDTWKVVIS